MLLDFNQIRNNFSRFSDKYDQNTSIQKKSSQILVEESLKYTNLTEGSKILDLGSGTGNIAKFLDDNNLSSNLTSCDFSLSMLNSQSVSSHKICADVNFLPFSKADIFSHIFSSFCFQWLSEIELEKLMNSSYNLLKLNGLFSFCLPIEGSFYEFFDANEESGCDFQFIELKKAKIIENFAKSSDFQLSEIRIISHKIKYSNILDFLKKIKASGANYNFKERRANTSVKKIKKISDILFEKYDNYVTWNVLYCYLIKK